MPETTCPSAAQLVLVFATAALRLMTDWGLSYAELIPYATPCFIAYGLFAIPAGWLADKWSREGMMAVFFFGIGSSSLLVGMAKSCIRTPVHRIVLCECDGDSNYCMDS